MREAESSMGSARPPAWTRWLVLSAAIIAADLATKAWVSSAFTLGESRQVLPFFNLVLMHNTGAAFSFLAGAGGWQRWFFTTITVVICAVILVMLKRNPANRLLSVALAMVLGGALGNLWDRVTLGYVVDFVLLYIPGSGLPPWPAFNVADSAISVGVALLVWDTLRPAIAGPRPQATGQEKP
jgi:signal peptidase II